MSIITNVVLSFLLIFYHGICKCDLEETFERSLYYKINVMSFNLGRYAWTTSPYGLLEEQVDEYIVNYNEFFEDNSCDILFLQEAGEFIDVMIITRGQCTRYARIEPSIRTNRATCSWE